MSSLEIIRALAFFDPDVWSAALKLVYKISCFLLQKAFSFWRNLVLVLLLDCFLLDSCLLIYLSTLIWNLFRRVHAFSCLLKRKLLKSTIRKNVGPRSHPAALPNVPQIITYRFPIFLEELSYLDKISGSQPFLSVDMLREYNSSWGEAYEMDWLTPLRLASADFWDQHYKVRKERVERKKRQQQQEYEIHEAKQMEMQRQEPWRLLCEMIGSRLKDLYGCVEKELREKPNRSGETYAPIFLELGQLIWIVERAVAFHGGCYYFEDPISEIFNERCGTTYAEPQLLRAIDRSVRLAFASIRWDQQCNQTRDPFEGELPPVGNDWLEDWFDTRKNHRSREHLIPTPESVGSCETPTKHQTSQFAGSLSQTEPDGQSLHATKRKKQHEYGVKSFA